MDQKQETGSNIVYKSERTLASLELVTDDIFFQ